MAELEIQVGLGLRAAADLNRALVVRPSTFSYDVEGAWLAIQGLMTACAMISKVLWPEQAPGKEVTRTELLGLIGLDEASPLHSRSIRNSFEHIDARIERWSKRSVRRNFAQSYIGPAGGLPTDSEDTFRTYDPATTLVTFQGEEVKLQELVEALTSLREPLSRYRFA